MIYVYMQTLLTNTGIKVSAVVTLGVLQSYAFAMKYGIGMLEAHHHRRRLAAAESAVQQSSLGTCEPVLTPDCELTAWGKLEHRLRQASVQYCIVLDQLRQVGS